MLYLLDSFEGTDQSRTMVVPIVLTGDRSPDSLIVEDKSLLSGEDALQLPIRPGPASTMIMDDAVIPAARELQPHEYGVLVTILIVIKELDSLGQ
jgi:hypothetical protein